MSKITIEATISYAYLRNKTKDEIIEHVMRLLKENDDLRAALSQFYNAFKEYHALGRLELLGEAMNGQRGFVATVVSPLFEGYEVPE